MHADTDADVLRLREGLSDLVALSAIPAVWIGSEPPAVAAGLADALVGLLQLDFAFVRLSDPGGVGAVEVTRGNAWPSFPEWLARRLATSAPLARMELVHDIGDDSSQLRGLAVPVGANGEGGVVAAASERSDFPTPMDQALLSLAANHATTAFQNARLIHERTSAERALRNARDQLEVKVAERTAELGRSEAYLAEAQRLTHTGSFAIDGSTGEVTHASDELSRLYGFDPERGNPSLDDFLQRVRPQDRSTCTDALERGIREATNIEVEYRVVLPQSVERHHRAIAHPVFDASGELDEVVGTIVDVTEHRRAETELERLAGEQAALRRVATLVAKEAAPAEVFATVAEEVAKVIGQVDCVLARAERDGTVTVGAAFGAGMSATVRVGERFPVDGTSVVTSVLSAGRPCRIDDYSATTGTIGERGRQHGIRSAVGCPIPVRGRIWGVIAVARYEPGPLPPETETHITQFTDLVATAIANAEARAEVERLAQEQAALGRVATLVAQGVQPAELFSAVSEEVGALFGSDLASVGRFDPAGPALVLLGIARAVEGVAIGSRWELDDSMVVGAVYRSGRAARRDGLDWSGVSAAIGDKGRRLGIVSAVASPIVVEGRLWGAISVTADEPLPLHAEERLEKFTGVVATAIANAESRGALRRLADEQAALRRVAMLVAEGAGAAAVFDAVAAEMERLLDAEQVSLGRYEPGAELTVVAHRGSYAWRLPAGSRLSHEGENVTAVVRRTERPARMEHLEDARGPIAQIVRAMGMRVSVGAPIVVDGRLWGVITARWSGADSPPGDTEDRMAQFAQLLDTAIANADSRDQLTASRTRLVTAGDEARRRVVRDLHDGAQQRLVHAVILLKLARRALRAGNGQAESLIGEALQHAEQSNAELRELAHGILPAALTGGGLSAAVDAVVTRLDLPVSVDVPAQRFAQEIEASAYFIVAEALTNVVKHAHAGRAEVRAFVDDGMLHVEVRDDGIGHADPGGHGLVGIYDRVTALGGRLKIESPAGGGTRVAATLPVSAG
jgi:signal transduction histidine kinase/PAS domain-containing protein